MVFGDERSDGVADRWRHFVQLHDAVVDGDRELLGPRHEQRRHRGLDDGDDHDLGAAASFGHCAGSDVATAESDDFVRPIRHRERRRERHRAALVPVVHRCERLDRISCDRRDVRQLHDAGAHDDDAVLGSGVERGGDNRLGYRDNYRQRPGGHRAGHYRTATRTDRSPRGRPPRSRSRRAAPGR